MRRERLIEASRLWRSGESGRAIAKAVGIKVSYLFDLAVRNRRLFPRRGGPRIKDRPFRETDAEIDVHAESLPDDQMRWITEGGTHVTLPRISGIECPRRGS